MDQRDMNNRSMYDQENAKGNEDSPIQRAQSKAGEVAEEAQGRAGQVVEKVREQATTRIENQKERVTGSLGSVADAVRMTGDQLRENDQAGMAQYTDMFADRIEQFSGYLRNKSVEEMFDEAERLARREPLYFLAGAFALGLLGARFFKSSRPSADEEGFSRRPGSGFRYAEQDFDYRDYPRGRYGMMRRSYESMENKPRTPYSTREFERVPGDMTAGRGPNNESFGQVEYTQRNETEER